MPYYMEASGGQFCVYKEGEKNPLECYDSEASAEDYLTALNIATDGRVVCMASNE